MTGKFSIVLFLAIALGITACAQESEKTETTGTPALETTAAAGVEPQDFNAPDRAWRDIDPENTLYVDTDYGRMVVELYPEISPGHVARIKTLARQKFYDSMTFHRVINDFMNQTGDPRGDGTGSSDLPDLQAEFTFRRAGDMPVTLVDTRGAGPETGEKSVGFYKAMPVATDPIAQAMLTRDGKVESFGIHCKGVASMARAGAPDSANSQFFLMRGSAPHLDAQYTAWGKTIWGHDVLTAIKVGTKGQTPDFIPDTMNRVRVVADVPAQDRLNVQVLKTDSPAFKNYLRQYKDEDGFYADICDIEVPTRLKPEADTGP
ncbi:MAG: peptidylprolyl isomerase [Hyphomonadaceae bacterium]|nr:peptidylprolyl isomerase [Hyphomonadaceae bacterium]